MYIVKCYKKDNPQITYDYIECKKQNLVEILTRFIQKRYSLLGDHYNKKWGTTIHDYSHWINGKGLHFGTKIKDDNDEWQKVIQGFYPVMSIIVKDNQGLIYIYNQKDFKKNFDLVHYEQTTQFYYRVNPLEKST